MYRDTELFLFNFTEDGVKEKQKDEKTATEMGKIENKKF